jgi:lysozyme family protein
MRAPVMKENRPAWLDLVRQVEGDAFSNEPRDPGGACRYGVTLPTLAAWRRQPVTIDDVRKLEWPECAELYSARYWNVIQGDKLPPGLDVAVGDMAVHSGTRQAARTLQRILGCQQDGHIGAKTLEAARAARLPDILLAFSAQRLAFLRTLPGWATFGRGWVARLDRVQTVALALSVAQVDNKPEPTSVARTKISTQAVLAAAGAVVAAVPAGRDAYVQATRATASLAELALWLPTALGLLVALLTVAMLSRRALRLADQQ